MTALHKQWYFLLLSALLISSAVYALNQTPFFRDIENRALDYWFRLYTISEEKVDDVVIVAIDDSSLRHFAENRIAWPWPRDYYAIVLDYFHAAGAKGVIFDILFYEPDFSADAFDDRFAAAMQAAENTLLAALMLPDASEIPERLNSFSVTPAADITAALPLANGVRAPIDLFLEHAGGIGSVNIEPDNDGVVRRAPLLYRLGDHTIPQLPMAALFLQGNAYGADAITRTNEKWYFNGAGIPVDHQGNYLINWYGKAGPQGAFQYYPFRSVVQSVIQMEKGETPVLPPETFTGRYVIIGATAPGLYDLKTTPVSQVHPGMEIWATILANFLHKDFIRQAPGGFSWLYTALVAFLLMFVFVRYPLKTGLFWLSGILFAAAALPIALWAGGRIHLNIVSPMGAAVFSLFYISTVSYVSEGKSKKEIKKAFSRYLHPEIIEQLAENPSMVDLEGREFEATVLFSDIYHFTDFSETTDPKTLIALLNKYFESLTEMVLDNDGMIDKFMGDGIMAVFGAPVEIKNHHYQACSTAIMHKRKWRQSGKTENRSQKPLNLHMDDHAILFHANTRIGIHSGPVVAGNMGSARRVDYTVIGDTVNLAARLEAINKYYKTGIIISESTYRHVHDRFVCRELDAITAKGKTKATKIYELLDFAGFGEEPYAWIDEYAEALHFYRQERWEKAIPLFFRLSMPPINDPASGVMLDRCKQLRDNMPKEWNGIYRWEVK